MAITEEFREELREAGYTEAQIAKEEAYIARVAWENSVIAADPAWNYGFHHASFDPTGEHIDAGLLA